MSEITQQIQQLAAQHLTLTNVACVLVGFLAAILLHFNEHAIGTRKRKDLYTIPGAHPLIGNMLSALSKSGGKRQMEWFSRERKRKDLIGDTRPMTLSVPGMRMIDCTKPELIEYIQKTNASNFIKGRLFESNMSDVLGGGIFVVDHEPWRVARKATSKIFTGALFRTVITSSIQQDLGKVKSILAHHAKNGETLDLSALFFAYTLSAFSRMAFSVDLETLQDTTTVPVPFAQAFDYAQKVMATRFNDPFWAIKEKFSEEGRKMRAAIKVLDEFSYNIIDQRESEGIVGLDKEAAGKTDLLSLYMAIRDETGKPMSKRALRDSVLNLIIAGRDTTAQALSWIFFHLINNPELVAPLRKEIDTIELVDYDTYKEMPQALAVFHEGLRLHPSVPKNGHQVVADDTLPDGTQLFAGDMVRWSDWEMGRFKGIWGEDAGTYRPSRWIDAQGNVNKENQYKFHAFNGGQRLCLGQALATYESIAALSTVTRDFDLTFAPEFAAGTEFIDVGDAVKTPRYEDSLTLPMLAPLLVKVTARAK